MRTRHCGQSGHIHPTKTDLQSTHVMFLNGTRRALHCKILNKVLKIKLLVLVPWWLMQGALSGLGPQYSPGVRGLRAHYGTTLALGVTYSYGLWFQNILFNSAYITLPKLGLCFVVSNDCI